ncbi:hypothetical protein EON79_04110 [bacterium]|nr:MAG: hypothetical protein EON79_04110 [bacterium]
MTGLLPLLPVMLPPGPSPLDNPLKGYASYADSWFKTQGPVSMGYFYVSWKELEPEEGKYAWEKLEKRWDSGVAKGKHVVLRLFLEYPGQPYGVPDWVPVRTIDYKDYKGGKTPDYKDPKLMEPLLRFIAAFGARYDTNPRVAFIALGTLGHWGEWHTWPSEHLFAPVEVQNQVVDAYKKAFPTVPILARYALSPSTNLPWLGYHDDYFPVDTLEGKDRMWRFLPAMKIAGRTENWKVAPIGAEIEPDKGGKWLGEGWDQTLSAAQQIHLSWIGPYSPAIDEKLPERSDELIQKIGYDFRLRRLDERADGGGWRVTVQGMNQGIAPFYRAWPIRLKDFATGKVYTSDADVRKWLPGPIAASFALPAEPKGALGFGIEDPWTSKPAISFANTLPKKEGWTIVRSAK